MDRKLVRDRMAQNAYAPSEHIDADQLRTEALQYIAFYLGEINTHLGAISGHLHSGNANGAKIATELQAVAHMLPRLKT